ncbi:DUF4466 domain-containing protein [Niabella ginsenosidivorans]|uniref:DUF4466 domain-containing protein n=1 Tax=Niabella ginsenosidivorans TaxID=1176587 RepID=A0A1A9HYS2_9BACT|nr:DUF4466 family protein [Niabella ginsenosidivorans]ANH80557.1 DUF4466 domain-containing protein [Niabella ginsenosidivorans]
MLHSIKIFSKTAIPVLAMILFFTGCKKKEYAVPVPKDVLQNDVIKRTLGPNIVGQQIEFAYAMAILPEKGKLVAAQVEASIAGATGTYLENHSYYTNGSGQDVGVSVAEPSVTNGTVTSVTYNVDTSAATLRYYYVIPEEARGKQVSFTFSAKSSNGETVSYKMGPYTIAQMNMVRNLKMHTGDSAYISIADMKVYDAAEAAANPDKIDLVYVYYADPVVTFNHALVSPAADVQYLPGVNLPAGLNKSTKVQKVFNLQDYNLAQSQYGIYIDDPDFQKLDLSNAPNFAINLKAEAGAWVETSDGKYRAYIYFNSVDNTNQRAIISMKRYAVNAQ